MNENGRTFIPKRVAIAVARRLLTPGPLLKKYEDDIGLLPTYEEVQVRPPAAFPLLCPPPRFPRACHRHAASHLCLAHLCLAAALLSFIVCTGTSCVATCC